VAARHRERTPTPVSRRTVLTAGVAAFTVATGALGGSYLAWGQGPYEPRLFGLSMDGSSPEAVTIAEGVGAELGRAPQALNFFMAWEWGAPFPRETVEAIRAMNAIPEITWEPWDPRSGADQPRFSLGNLTAFDEYVDGFARGCAEYGDEVHIRFGHEMNSDWYPWSVTANGGSPGAYVDAYRRLHDRFVQNGATNVRWVWCPNIVYKDQPDLIPASYPGDDVVDVIAVDGYNHGGRSPENVFGATLAILDGISSSKPLWINEVGCTPDTDKTQWIGDLFDYLHTTRVGTLLWFELLTPDKPDWRLLGTPETAAVARSVLQNW
jgi:hypothetical protein